MRTATARTVVIVALCAMALSLVGASPAGAADGDDCPPGYYGPGEPDCTPAPPGTYVDQAGQQLATPCPAGTYQNLSGATSCFFAPIGSYVSHVGAVSATPCPPGTTTLFVGSASVEDCVSVAAVPPSASACKKGGWAAYTDDTGRPFRNAVPFEAHAA